MNKQERSERNAKLVAMWMEGVPLRLCGAEFGLTGERVRQIIAAAGLLPDVGGSHKARAPKRALRAEQLAARIAERERRKHEKECCICKQTKPLVEFSIAKRGAHGRGSRCRECNRAYAAARYHDQSTGSAERQKAWQKANRDKTREYTRRYYAKKRAAQGASDERV